MSFTNDLLYKFDNNIQYFKLSEIIHIYQGGALKRDEVLSKGLFPVMNGGIDYSGYYDKWNYDSNVLTVSHWGSSAGHIHRHNNRFWANNACWTFAPANLSFLDKDYLFHYLKSQERTIQKTMTFGGATPNLSRELFFGQLIPVPPLEVQREIVRVLDDFTCLTAELTAELQLRKKQYEFYRNKMLSFERNVMRIPMGELFDFKNGLSKGKEFFGKGFPFIRYTDVYNYRSLKKKDINALVECTPNEIQKLKVSKGDVLFTRTSETAEDVGWSSVILEDIDNCVFNGFSIKASPKTNLLLPEYCAYCFATGDFRNYVTKHCAFTTRASLTGNTIAGYKLAVPSIEVQKSIVAVLDSFEIICSDLSIGLPAEIEARKKQYEYYRDKLLTFKEKRNEC